MTDDRRRGQPHGGTPKGWSWTRLIVLAFGLNLTWELTHGRLYAHDIPTWIYLRAAGVDAALIAGATLLARRSGRGFWAVLVGSLLMTAIGIELWALSVGRWSYTDAMPTIGPVGVSPLFQLPLTGAVTALVADSARLRRSRGGAPTDPPPSTTSV